MGRNAIVLSLAALAGCSFVDDFDKFKAADSAGGSERDGGEGDATGSTQTDAAAPRDAGSERKDSGPSAPIDSSIADAAVDAYVPPPACGGTVCDDGDPCTRDTCAGTQCAYVALDADGDGYSAETCKLGSSVKGGDCNDDERAVHPGATEVCDEVDNDCNGSKDDGLIKVQCYPDLDQDSFANLDGAPVAVCTTCPPATKAVAAPIDRNMNDCWDDPTTGGARVYPGQDGFYQDGFGPGGRKFDYNCNGKDEPKFGVLKECGGLIGLVCTGSAGFIDELPACGETGSYQTCATNGLTCSGTTDKGFKQTCN
ncbi:MAG TPA: putative metal-binding motif-containing protein [Polyangiales bacterium]|nr:putative metal-binding motif-containing protein [Polyangiales bacterium]